MKQSVRLCLGRKHNDRTHIQFDNLCNEINLTFSVIKTIGFLVYKNLDL